MRLGLVGKTGQTWKPFLKAKDKTEKAKKETTDLHFFVTPKPPPATWERR